jgi:glycine oxidase
VGEVGEGIYAATGHGRNGVLLAPWTAKRLLGLMGVEG